MYVVIFLSLAASALCFMLLLLLMYNDGKIIVWNLRKKRKRNEILKLLDAVMNRCRSRFSQFPPTVKYSFPAMTLIEDFMKRNSKIMKRVWLAWHFLENRRLQFSLPAFTCDACNVRVCLCVYAVKSLSLNQQNGPFDRIRTIDTAKYPLAESSGFYSRSVAAAAAAVALILTNVKKANIKQWSRPPTTAATASAER